MSFLKSKKQKPAESNVVIESEKDVIEKIVKRRETGWDEVGFSRPIGGFFYNYILFIVGALIVLAIGSTLLPLIVPFPEIFGNSTIVIGYFKLMFTLFDAGLGDALGRYLPEYRIKNPKRAIQYISFFIWFQMWTGLVQITFIAVFIFSWLPQISIAHLAWFMLVYSTVQYPGMLSVFGNVLRSFQQFGKIQLISFLQDTFLQNVTTVAFTLLFGWLFTDVPPFGFVFGASLGYIVGQYVDDFLALVLGAVFFSQVMKTTGFTAMDAMRPTFNREVIKESLGFGLKTMIGPIYGTAFEFFRLSVMIILLPSYGTWLGLLSLAKGIAGLANIAGPMASWTGISVSESYNNNKTYLSYHYMKSALKWQTFITFFFLPQIVITLPPLLFSAISILGTDWVLAIPLIAPATLEPLLATFDAMPFSIIPKVGKRLGNKERDGKIEYQAMKGSHILERQGFSVLETTLSFGFLVLLIVAFPVNVYTFIFAAVPVKAAFVVIGWWYIDRKIIKLKINDWIGQGIIATGIATGAFCVFLFILTYVIYPPLYDAALDGFTALAGADTGKYLSLLPGILIILAALLLFPAGVFAPLYALFGGWDDQSLEDFRKAAMLSGPSKGITMFMYNVSKLVHDRSPWKNKFAFKDTDKALAEADELLQIRRELDAKIVMEKQFAYKDDLKELMQQVQAAENAGSMEDARRTLKYMVSIAEGHQDSALAGEYKKKLHDLS